MSKTYKDRRDSSIRKPIAREKRIILNKKDKAKKRKFNSQDEVDYPPEDKFAAWKL